MRELDRIARAVSTDTDDILSEQARAASDYFYFLTRLEDAKDLAARHRIDFSREAAGRRNELRCIIAEERHGTSNPTERRLKDRLEIEDWYTSSEDRQFDLDARVKRLEIIVKAIDRKANMLIGISADQRKARNMHHG